jgi:hypothetical protein
MPNIEPEKVVRVRRGNSGRYLFPNIRKAASAVRARRVHGSGDLVGYRSMPVYDNAVFLPLIVFARGRSVGKHLATARGESFRESVRFDSRVAWHTPSAAFNPRGTVKL